MKTKPPVPVVSLSPLPPATRRILETLQPPLTVYELPSSSEEDAADPLQVLEDLEPRLPDGPLVVLLQDEERPRQLDSLLSLLRNDARQLHMVIEQGFGFEGPSRQVTLPLPWDILLQGTVLLDSSRIQSRCPGTVTIGTLFETRARLLAYLIMDLCASLTLPRTSRVRKQLSGTLSWEGSWPCANPPGQALLGLMRLRDGQFPSVTVVHRKAETDPHRRLRARLKREGMPCAWPKPGSMERVGGFFRM